MVPRFGLPSSIQSDSGSALFAKVTQEVSQQWETQWKFLGATIRWKKKTEKMNHTLKKTTAKCFQETNLKWDKVFLIALLRMTVAPRRWIQLSPYEILYGGPSYVLEKILERLMT